MEEALLEVDDCSDKLIFKEKCFYFHHSFSAFLVWDINIISQQDSEHPVPLKPKYGLFAVNETDELKQKREMFFTMVSLTVL